MICILFLVAFSFAGADAADPINVALRKPAVMSKQYGAWSGDSADKGVDGNTDQTYGGHSCFHTQNEPVNFWRVDLLDTYKLTSVKVFNRVDCCSDRAFQIALLVGESVENMTQVAFWADQIDDIQTYEMPENTVARYVEFRQTDADTYLHFCEVEVYALPVDPINVALNKPAVMSKQYGAYSGDSADKGVDGNTDQSYGGHSCFHTQNEPVNFWRVDLQDTYKLSSVKVYNRMDCCSDQGSEIALLVGESVDDMTQVAYSADQIDDIQTYEMPENTVARYVEFRQTDTDNVLSFCEVEVYVDPVNVALNKPAVMSKQYGAWSGDSADKGVDGNTDPTYGGHSCFHTQNEPVNFWRVDLQDTYNLTSVKVYNRMDCCSDQAIQIALLVGESVEDMTQVAYSADQIDDIQTFEMPENTVARYVEFRQTDTDTVLHFCEVEVYALPHNTCPVRTTLQNGHLVSCSHNNIHGSECTYVCDKGYNMIGSDKATCKEDGNWDKTPTCQKAICPKPFDLLNGIIDCSDSYNFESHCIFECDDGFKKVGSTQMICQADQTWSVTKSEVQCKDEEAPEITCSTPKVFYADRGTFSASVTWDEPTAKDNADSDAVIVQISGPSQGDVLEEGIYYVTYSASDKQGNKNQCKSTLDVKVVKCSTGPYDALSNARFIKYNCTDAVFYNGVSCSLECDLNLPLHGAKTMLCERDGTTGNGVWVWQSSEPFCEVAKCPPLDPPANGAFTTDSVNARPLHVMLCQKGYDIPAVGSAFLGRLSCQDSGNWYPLPAFPNCIVPIIPWLKLPAELYYEGDCNSNATAEQIKQQVLVYLNGVKADIDQSICPDVETCKVENLEVFCGDTSGRRRRSALSHELLKRQSQSNFALATWDFVTVFDKGNKSVEDAFLDVLDVFKQLKTKLVTDVSSGKLDVAGFTLSSDAFKIDSKPTFTCKSGSKLDVSSVSCKPCPSGTYYNSTTNTCEYCDFGTYVNHDGATVCKTCPTGYSTLSKGSKMKTDCLKLCSPGYFSSTMMEPCIACPVGTFQPLRGQISCTLCPPGTATNAHIRQ